MTELAVIFILITFGMVFYFLYQKDQKDRDRVDTILKTFENTILQVVTSLEKTNNKFYEMASKIEIEHFKQLEKQSAKQALVFEKTVDKLLIFKEHLPEKDEEIIKKISSIDEIEQNSIEKEETLQNPLDDFPYIPIKDGVNIQVEGEEEIYPINIT